MTVSAILGALVAGVAAYTVSPLLWQTAMGLRSGGPEQTADAKPAFEEWPICTMTVAMPDADWAKLDPEFAAGKKAVVAEDWDGAIAVLKSAALRDPRNADIQNYIGYAHRRLRQMGPAIGHYQQALTLNPRHRSAQASRRSRTGARRRCHRRTAPRAFGRHLPHRLRGVRRPQARDRGI